MKVKKECSRLYSGLCDGMSEVEVISENIHTVFVNETVPIHLQDDFYGDEYGEYATSIHYLFQDTPLANLTPKQLLKQGIYITNVLKNPKTQSQISTEDLRLYASVLQEELSWFVNCQHLFLMGDVAIRAYTIINRMQGKKRIIPAGSTYKLRKQPFWDGEMRIVPSYIMTGKNLQIEKSKVTMIREDINSVLNCAEEE